MAKTGKISKNVRSSTMFGPGEAQVVIENDNTKGKVFVEVKKLLKEASIGFQNLSSSHPIIINKGSFEEAVTVVKTALADGESSRYTIEKEEPGLVSLLEKSPKEPSRMVIRESPFAWHNAG